MQLYLDGQLEDADRLRAEKLLKEDPQARAEMEVYERIRRALRDAATPGHEISQPDFMWTRVKETIERGAYPPDDTETERTPWWNWDYRWAFTGVAAGVILALGLIYWSRQDVGTVAVPNYKGQGYSSVTVYTFDPEVYPAEYRSQHARATVIWLTGVDAYGQKQEKF
jgi:hypothetical protein